MKNILTLRRQVICILQCLILISLILCMSACTKKKEEPTTEVTYNAFEQTLPKLETPITLVMWYNDVEDAPYLEAAATAFQERYGILVTCEYHDDVSYLESINQANISGNGPDIFMNSNDMVCKMRMADLAEQNTLYTDDYWEKNYPEICKNALTSDGKQYGYPVNFDTYCMIYDSSITQAPTSISSITDFSVNFEDESNAKTIFQWDISNPFYDYMFLGGYAKVLGENGEDETIFDVTNENVASSMTYYQSLHDYFSIDVDASSYENVKQGLSAGTLVYGICETDVLKDIATYPAPYQLTLVPPLTDTLDSAALSVTYAAFVNPYTKNMEYANLFGAYLSYEYADEQFTLSQKISTRSSMEHKDENEMVFYQQYEQSTPTPKALESGDYWTYSGIAYKNIWNGSSVADELNSFQNKMNERLK